jgi:hypothetical protein
VTFGTAAAVQLRLVVAMSAVEVAGYAGVLAGEMDANRLLGLYS